MLLLLWGAATRPADALAQEAVGASLTLTGAEIDVEVASEVAARVRAAYDFSGSGPPTLMLAWFPGQTLSELRVEVNGVLLAARFSVTGGPALRELRLPQLAGGAHHVVVEYSVAGTDGFPFRYPLAVPRAAVEGSERVVAVRVGLPADAHPSGDSFPALQPNGAGDWSAELVGVPSFVHVVHAARLVRFGLATRLELVVILLILTPVGVLLTHWWRRERNA